MSALEIISTLRALNLSLSIDGDKLHVQGAAGLLLSPDKQQGTEQGDATGWQGRTLREVWP